MPAPDARRAAARGFRIGIVDVAGAYGPDSAPNIVIARSSPANVLCICSLEDVYLHRQRIGQNPPKAEAHLDRKRGQTVCPGQLAKTGLNCWKNWWCCAGCAAEVITSLTLDYKSVCCSSSH